MFKPKIKRLLVFNSNKKYNNATKPQFALNLRENWSAQLSSAFLAHMWESPADYNKSWLLYSSNFQIRYVVNSNIYRVILTTRTTFTPPSHWLWIEMVTNSAARHWQNVYKSHFFYCCTIISSSPEHFRETPTYKFCGNICTID